MNGARSASQTNTQVLSITLACLPFFIGISTAIPFPVPTSQIESEPFGNKQRSGRAQTIMDFRERLSDDFNLNVAEAKG